jgi:hypothetical protein
LVAIPESIMLRRIFYFILFFSLSRANGQIKKSSTAFVSGHYNKTLYDGTKGNNPWSIGLEAQAVFKTKALIQPSVEIGGDIFLAGNKSLRLNPDGSIPTEKNEIGTMLNLYGGIIYDSRQFLIISLLGGANLINGRLFAAIKPSIGCYIARNRNWMIKASFTTIKNRYRVAKEDYGSFGFSLGHRLY